MTKRGRMRSRRVVRGVPVFALTLMTAILAARAWATAGTLDPSFGDGGRVVVDFSPDFDRANAVASQPDGKVVIAGTDDLSSDRAQFALVRLNPDGSLDQSFGNGGMRTIGFGQNRDDEASSVALDSDGRIVVAGDSDNRGVVARLNPDGSLDRSFSGDGRAKVGTYLDIRGVALQQDGRIVVTATKWSLANKLAVVRPTTSGALDKSFADAGLRTVSFPGRHNYGETDDIAGGSCNPGEVQSDCQMPGANGAAGLVRVT